MAERIIRIAIDAMGGDNAPKVLVEGAVEAVNAYDDVEIVLVGERTSVSSCLDAELGKSDASGGRGDGSERVWFDNRISLVHADETIGMDESPARAIRRKKNASVVVANRLCKSGKVSAVIAAGSTGAAMASSLLQMGRLKGVQRPAIMSVFPSKKNTICVIDVGANVDCKSEHLYQFGVMASIYMKQVLGYEKPRVGLLSIGEERKKGNELTIEAYGLFEKSDLNFIGNIEGRDVFEGIADVVVCDGFVGNVLLKFGESMFGFVTYMLKRHINGRPLRKTAALMMKPVFRDIRKDMSPENYGGAPLLGVDGISIICHGNSSARAVRNAVKVARQLVIEGVNEKIKNELSHASIKTNE